MLAIGVPIPCFSNNKLLDYISPEKIETFGDILRELITLESQTQQIISIIGSTFDVSCTIYQDAKADEVKSGWGANNNSSNRNKFPREKISIIIHTEDIPVIFANGQLKANPESLKISV